MSERNIRRGIDNRELQLSQNSLSREALIALVNAKVGETVEINVPLIGPLSIAYMNGIKPRFDSEGHILLDLPSPNGATLTPGFTLHHTQTYANEKEYVEHNGWVPFRKYTSSATAKAMQEQKISEETDQLKRSSIARARKAGRYFADSLSYLDIDSFTSSIRASIKVLLTGERFEWDSSISIDSIRDKVIEVVSDCFEPDFTKVSVAEGEDLGQRELVATFHVKKNADFPFTLEEILRFARRGL